MRLRKEVDSESVYIRGGGVLSRLASVFVCESCEWDAEATAERFRMQIGLTEESRWDSELRSGEEQVDLQGGLVEKIDTT